ncbi:hypothetical protein BJF92_08735 [Rhizobium rhizosphaerae]|uniref:Uncharacterized protein n=1 Tax=Xaviernesmea rhizosphaerae TaxID=1672749 RepID=A0A1Q9AQI4_9HYPH|nr:hypothetical protein [Xaviernesmea rhizosphaerae]OLP57693.1 hypothetical protein BJF92_08735 [Xaviernesmea rhizosphaerae]OQP84188.1 hypothetical protein BTR14_20510 [Xaviernesmea rhizosphaerae]
MPGVNAVYEVVLFTRDARGHAVIAGPPEIMADAASACARAESLAAGHEGVAAIRRPVQPAIGETGPIEILFQSGRLGDLG